MSKKYSNYIYGCPFCWQALEIGKKPKIPVYCHKDRTFIKPEELITFDSKIEYNKGLELKIMEKGGMIGELKHHEMFPFFDIYFDTDMNRVKWIPAIRLNGYPDEEIKKTDIHLNSWDYESDFSFIQSGIKRVIEIKDLGKKSITRSVRTYASRKKYEDKMPWPISSKIPLTKFKEKIPWPFLTGKTLTQFRKKCQLMKAIYGINVEIWAGSKAFRFNEKWKLMEITK